MCDPLRANELPGTAGGKRALFSSDTKEKDKGNEGTYAVGTPVQQAMDTAAETPLATATAVPAPAGGPVGCGSNPQSTSCAHALSRLALQARG